MIRNFKLKFGRAPNVAGEQIQTAPITVFVGPNNSGKSKVLQEIFVQCTNGNPNMANVILEHIEFEPLSTSKAEERINSVTLTPNFGETIRPNHVFVGKKGARHDLPRQQLISVLENPSSNLPAFAQWYLSYNTLKLDGANRIGLAMYGNSWVQLRHG